MRICDARARLGGACASVMRVHVRDLRAATAPVLGVVMVMQLGFALVVSGSVRAKSYRHVFNMEIVAGAERDNGLESGWMVLCTS